MQDTFWTTELVNEYAGTFLLQAMKAIEAARNGGAVEKIISASEFIASKSPKKEWEIVAYRVRDKNVYYPEYTDDIGRIWGNAEWKGAFIDSADVNHPDVKIFSVRRLSDDTTWSVEEKVDVWETGRFTIQSFEISAGKMLVKTDGGTYLLNALIKLPQPILTTVDGVDIYEGMKYWPVSKDTFNIYTVNIASEVDRGKWGGAYLFSTRQAAEEYILNNRPVLSLNDVRKVIAQLEYVRHASDAIQELTALVKQKQNQ